MNHHLSINISQVEILNFEGREFRQFSVNIRIKFPLYVEIVDTDSEKGHRIYSSLESFDFMRNYLKNRGSITTISHYLQY